MRIRGVSIRIRVCLLCIGAVSRRRYTNPGLYIQLLERRADALGLRLVFAHRAATAAFALSLVKLVARDFAAPVPALPPSFPSATAAGFLLGIVGLHPAFALWSEDGFELRDALGV